MKENNKAHKRKEKPGTKRSHLFDYDDSLLCGLVSDNVEYVMTPDDTVLHLCIAPDVGIIGLDTSDGTSNLCRLHGTQPEGIYT